MKDFIDSLNESEWKKWVEFKMKKPRESQITTAEEAINEIREILSTEDGQNTRYFQFW